MNFTPELSQKLKYDKIFTFKTTSLHLDNISGTLNSVKWPNISEMLLIMTFFGKFGISNWKFILHMKVFSPVNSLLIRLPAGVIKSLGRTQKAHNITPNIPKIWRFPVFLIILGGRYVPDGCSVEKIFVSRDSPRSKDYLVWKTKILSEYDFSPDI